VPLGCLADIHSHGLNDAALKDIYFFFFFRLKCDFLKEDKRTARRQTVVLAKLLYASPAWWGFATESDKHRIEAFVC